MRSGPAVAVLMIGAFSTAPRAQSPRPGTSAVVAQHEVQSSALGQALSTSRTEPITIAVSATDTLTLQREAIERGANGHLIWRGRVAGEPRSSVTIAIADGGLFGLIDAGTDRYQIRSGSASGYIAERIDVTRFPREAAPLPIDPAAADRTPARTAADQPADDGSLIDVLVVYTPAARNEAGGTAAMQALIDLAVSRANTSYANSGVRQRLRLVHREEVAYVESGSAATDLARLRNEDGTMDVVHALRDQYAADFVSLFTAARDVCGIGYLLSPMSAGLASYAFNVSAWHCAAANLSFPHELGHNMGLEHDAANASSTPTAPYAYGYRDPGYFRDVMAYACEPDGLPRCDRVLHFSTHTRTYEGRVTGVQGSAEAARALDDTAPITANFRTSTTTEPCTFSISPTSASVASGARTDTIQVSTSGSTCQWTAASSEAFVTITAGASGSGPGTVTYAISGNDASAARSASILVAGRTFAITQAGRANRVTPTFDLNGDGRLDLLWRHEMDGRISGWAMNGTSRLSVVTPAPNQVADTSWTIAGTGDLDGDGHFDIVWQNVTDGRVSAWFMTGFTLRDGSLFSIPQVPDLQWRIRSVGDLDGDGKADLIWQHDGNGSVAVWRMDGVTVLEGTLLNPSSTDPVWRLAGSADFDGDGRRDLLWQHRNEGWLAVWLMDGTNRTGVSALYPNQVPEAAWKIRAVGDLDGDGDPDLIWQHDTDRRVSAWLMSGLVLVDGRLLEPSVAGDPAWTIVGPK